MTRISCEVARDLLPLYCDDVCSQESRILIEEHLKNCSDYFSAAAFRVFSTPAPSANSFSS